jgi:hypothetical protein
MAGEHCHNPRNRRGNIVVMARRRTVGNRSAATGGEDERDPLRPGARTSPGSSFAGFALMLPISAAFGGNVDGEVQLADDDPELDLMLAAAAENAGS